MNMVSTTVLALFEVAGIFLFGVSISWLLFRILRTKLQHTPQAQKERSPSHAKELRLAVEEARLEVAKTKLRTEQIRLLALQTRASVVGGKDGRSDDAVDTS